MREQHNHSIGMRTVLQAAGAACLALCVTVPVSHLRTAQADEAVYCVTCVNPDEHYACTVASKGPLPGDAVQLYCIMRTAKKGGHASCSARRGAPNTCPGTAMRYDYEGPAPQQVLDGLSANPKVQKIRKRMEQEQKSFAQPKKKESNAPGSVVEVIGNSRERLRQARSRLQSEAEPTAADPTVTYGTQQQPRKNVHVPWAAPDGTETMPQQAAPAPETYHYAPAQTQTVEQPGMARRAAQSAGNAARCMWSLFRRCRRDDE
jgi:hypothetical protein